VGNIDEETYKDNEYKSNLNPKMANENNPRWVGDKIKCRVALHNWVRRRIPKPELCQRCQQKPSFDLANKTGIYSRDLNNWEWLCRKCHMNSDGRMNNLKRNPKLSPEEKKISIKKSYEKNKEKILKRHKKYTQENKEMVNIWSRESYSRNKRNISEMRKKRRNENIKAYREKENQYREKNKEKIRKRNKEYIRKWRKDHAKSV
jgi:hypothetical protein